MTVGVVSRYQSLLVEDDPQPGEGLEELLGVEPKLRGAWPINIGTRLQMVLYQQPAVGSQRLDETRPQTAALAEALGGTELAVIIHSAGIYRGFPRAEMMEVNAEAPIRVVESLLGAGAPRSGAIVAIMTSQVGARRGRTDGLGDYGDSKAALNDEFRRRAGDWGRRGVIAFVVHPGWVRTDMGGASATLSVEESATGIRRVIDGLTNEQHGRFLTWEGREHPW